MRPDERESLRRQYEFCCGYCGVRESDVGAQLTIDHFQPQSQGGSDEPENCVYCCHACNEFKGDYWQPNSIRRVLHPLADDLGAHVVEKSDGRLEPLSETGAFHIKRLHLNRPQLVAYRERRRLLKASRQLQDNLLRLLQQLEGQVKSLTTQLEQLDLP